ncbi:MAG TPA: hypothetical protein VLG12_02785 [Candidatus Saccharimonadales bacterium]|nr:hypothetical protein [Candidatus Saccharimonadales bacterium]
MDLQQEVEVVKQELVALIVQHLKENKIELAMARKLAGDFLLVLPVRDQHDLLLKLKNLGGEYAEAREIYVRELGKINEEKRHQALSQMHDLIQKGQIEDAITVAKATQKTLE